MKVVRAAHNACGVGPIRGPFGIRAEFCMGRFWDASVPLGLGVGPMCSRSPRPASPAAPAALRACALVGESGGFCVPRQRHGVDGAFPAPT